MVERHDVAPVVGYDPELGLLLAALDDATNEVREELGDLDEAGLVGRPFPDGPSVGAVLLHMAESEAWWIQETVGGKKLPEAFRKQALCEETDPSVGRWGDAPAMPLAAYYRFLDEVRERTREVLRSERPGREIKPDPERPALTVRWIVSHLVQHEAYHGGQTVLIKRMLTGGTW